MLFLILAGHLVSGLYSGSWGRISHIPGVKCMTCHIRFFFKGCSRTTGHRQSLQLTQLYRWWISFIMGSLIHHKAHPALCRNNVSLQGPGPEEQRITKDERQKNTSVVSTGWSHIKLTKCRICFQWVFSWGKPLVWCPLLPAANMLCYCVKGRVIFACSNLISLSLNYPPMPCPELGTVPAPCQILLFLLWSRFYLKEMPICCLT